jgi:hypothetical protein
MLSTTLVTVVILSLVCTVSIPLSSTSISLSKGYVNGEIAFFIATDASDNQTAASIADNL